MDVISQSFRPTSLKTPLQQHIWAVGSVLVQKDHSLGIFHLNIPVRMLHAPRMGDVMLTMTGHQSPIRHHLLIKSPSVQSRSTPSQLPRSLLRSQEPTPLVLYYISISA